MHDDERHDATGTGLPYLLGLAAADPDYATALEVHRDAAVRASGVTLSPAEAAMLAAVSGPTLRGLIRGVEPTLPAPTRRAFLTRAGQALAALAAAGVIGAPAAAARPAEPTPADEEALEQFLRSSRVMEHKDHGPSGTGSRPDPVDLPTDLVRYGAPVVTGPLDRSRLRAMLQSRTFAKVHQGYRDELAKNRLLGGKIVVVFRLGTDGNVSGLRLETDTVKSTRLADCVKAAFVVFKGPQEKAPTDVKQPIDFVPPRTR